MPYALREYGRASRPPTPLDKPYLINTTATSLLVFAYLLLGGGATAYGQANDGTLTLDPDYTAERLVKEVFATDRCETIFNVKQIGNNGAGIGYFSGPDDIVGFNRGIILSTGKITDAAGPNSTTKTGSSLSGPTPDADLDLAARGIVHDRSGVEFDFVPLESEVSFRYVFASEEYCEFVGAEFNDIFGFFISGPGFNGNFADGAVNVATIPGTRSPVSINTVNFRQNKEYYLDNEAAGVRQASKCGGGTTNGPRFGSIEYDGQTVILTATIKVQVCETYHIRLVVADVNDDDLDSAVFLEAGSFNLGASATLEGADEDAPITLFEGCRPSPLRIFRGPDSDLTRDQTVSYRLSTASVATDTTDFDSGRGRATIPAGEEFVEVPLTAYADTLSEGDETAWLVLDVPCACFTDSVRIIVKEPQPMEIGQEEDFVYCPGGDSRLSADVRGGVPPFTYQWNFGSTEAEPPASQALPDTVAVQITDACGQVIEWRAATLASAPPTVSFPPQDLSACRDQTVQLRTELTGVGPFDVTFRVDGGPEQQYTFLQGGSVDWPIERGGTYQITAVEDRACGNTADARLLVRFYQPKLRATYTDPTCYGLADGSLTARHLQTLPPYEYTLNGSPVAGPTLDALEAGTYTLAVTDSLGCTDDLTVALLEPEPLQPIVVTCEQLRSPPLSIRASGGTPPYAYSTNGGAFTDELGLRGLQTGATYQLRIKDASGCEIEQPGFYFPAAATRAVTLPNQVTQLAGGSTLQLTYRVPVSQVADYRWSPAELFDCPTCAEPKVTAPYTQPVSLVVTDIYGCVDSLTTRIAVDGSEPVYVPNVFSPNGDGNNDYATLFARPGVVTRVRSFRIFTRWGALVYEATDVAPDAGLVGWDGQLGSRPAQSGVYTWVAEIERFDGTLGRLGGSITLLGR